MIPWEIKFLSMQYNAFLCALDIELKSEESSPKWLYVYQHIHYPHLGSPTPNPPIFFRLEKMSNTTGLLIWDEKNKMPKPNNTAISNQSAKRWVLAQWLQTGLILHSLSLTALCGPSQLDNKGCPESAELKPTLEHTDVSGETPTDYSARKALLWPPWHPSEAHQDGATLHLCSRKISSSTCAAGLQHNQGKPRERGAHMQK